MRKRKKERKKEGKNITPKKKITGSSASKRHKIHCKDKSRVLHLNEVLALCRKRLLFFLSINLFEVRQRTNDISVWHMATENLKFRFHFSENFVGKIPIVSKDKMLRCQWQSVKLVIKNVCMKKNKELVTKLNQFL